MYLSYIHSELVCHCRAIQWEATHHLVLHTGEAVVPMVITLQLHTVVQHINQEVLMVLTEPQVREGSMGRHQGVPPAVIMEVTGDSLMEDSLMEGIMDTMLLQVTVG